ncbi:hypothetical protein A2Z22_04970 [Candidatus Woesebacteria bacterium RBG_16_34_12]|uniref:Uncharacterized protein n=1 Tax=Candidatus Woesebacteria bacterium RBG_16_34_12 TaxID=1802480 RepID=A0A1F7XBM0_9BACT|nr:MAG: hypothetical protein A2Z22_04970 [Candidatus Woesebacteria bacterium RBG_16_34_12]
MSSPWKINYSRYKRFFLNTLTQYQKRRDLKSYLEILLSLATIAVFSVFALRPTLLTIARLLKEIEGKEETLTKLDNKIGDLNKARTLYEREKERVSLLDQSIPYSAYPEVIIRQFQGVSAENATKVGGLSIGEVKLVEGEKVAQQSINLQNKGSLEKISFNLSASSSYLSMVGFLSTLENLRRPVSVNSLTVETSKDSQENSLNFTISGVTYFLKNVNITKAD